jgi:hypothetical protein
MYRVNLPKVDRRQPLLPADWNRGIDDSRFGSCPLLRCRSRRIGTTGKFHFIPEIVVADTFGRNAPSPTRTMARFEFTT